jgi:hypothetical protein
VRVLVRDDWRACPHARWRKWQTALQGARVRFPVPDDGWQIRILPGLETIGSDNDLGDWDGWDDVMEDLDDVAGDASDSWSHIWVGLLPAHRPGSTASPSGASPATPTTSSTDPGRCRTTTP